MTQPSESRTPETDALLAELKHRTTNEYVTEAQWVEISGVYVPYALARLLAHARSLELRLADEQKLSSAISRDCNATALERNELRDRLAAETAAREGAEISLIYETAIVDRIWDMLGRPSYEELKGRSIYDLIADLQQAREAAERALRSIRDFPITDAHDMDAANMALMARASLPPAPASGEGRS